MLFSVLKWKVKLIVLTVSFGIVGCFAAFGQDEQVNLNTYYRFPLSLGIEYQSYSPFAQYGSSYNIFEIAGNVRWPIPPIPILQLNAKGGMISFDSQDLDNPLKWDHTHWFGGLGIVLSHRFSKNFEVGAEITGAITQSIFNDLSPETGPVGTRNIIGEAGLRIGINPSYNFNIDVHPSVKYLHSFGAMTQYNGFILAVGFSGNFRLGKDPDSPQAIIRSIRFDTVEMPPLFAAMQSYYVKNPAGSVTFTNSDKTPINDVNVSFFQKGYMDSPTLAAAIDEIEAGKQITVELPVSFNGEVFTTEGVTPLTGEVIITYTSSGRAAEQRQSVTYDLHDKTALTWDDDRKVSAFITPADSALRNYTSFIRQTCKDETVPGFSKNLQTAMQIYNALGVIGCLYQVDPQAPFTEMQENPVYVDSISLPRDTLKRITGDCDDLTVLYSSLLETVGIQSGFITVPGHIYSVFNTGIASRDYEQVHSDRDMTIDINGELWVPVEITMIGRDGFLAAWRKGIEEYRIFDQEPRKRGFYITAEAQKEYRPVGLKETDLGLQYGSSEKIVTSFKQDINVLIDQTLSPVKEAVADSGDAKSYNKLGIIQAQYKRYGDATDAFKKALEINRGYLGAKVNLANIEYINGNYEDAVREFLDVLNDLEQTGRDDSRSALKILLNTSRSFYALQDFENAKKYYSMAEKIDKDTVDDYSYLASVSDSGDGTIRAAEAIEETIFFIEDEEE